MENTSDRFRDRLTGEGWPSFRRLAKFVLVVGALALLVVVIDTNLWRELGRLQDSFLAIKAEKFYFGVKFRGRVRSLNSTLLDYYLTGNTEDLSKCRVEAQQMRALLAEKEGSFMSPMEDQAFAHLERTYTEYVEQIGPLLQPDLPSGTDPQLFPAIYDELRGISRPLLRACSADVEAERVGFDLFLQKSDRVLLWLQRWFAFSVLLLLTLAGSVAVLVYRGMLAPLHARLTASQAVLERREKLAALGALAAGVAHEIRNPLTAIKFRLFSLRKSLPPAFTDNEDTEVISQEINRLDRILRDFLEFARPSAPRLVPVPAEQILKQVWQLMHSELEGAGITLQQDAPAPAWINADTQQMKQVLINLVRNAAESISGKGTVTLRLRRAVVELGGRSTPAAILAVIDDGKGVAPEVQRRLFDPFFSTKEGGSGLGLAIAARIIEKHGGLIQYRTERNRGTSFEVVLPALDGHASENPSH